MDEISTRAFDQAQAAALARQNGVGAGVARTSPKNAPQVVLPDDKRSAVEYGLTMYQTMANERDMARRELEECKSQLAGFKIAVEAQTSQITLAESRVAAMIIERDRAVAERSQYWAVLKSIQAQLGAFGLPPDVPVDDHGVV
jgi:hypothetical protein